MTNRAHLPGRDMHLIPGQGQDQVKWKDSRHEAEQAYRHQEEIALHHEQQRVKENLAAQQKRVFNTPRQS